MIVFDLGLSLSDRAPNININLCLSRSQSLAIGDSAYSPTSDRLGFPKLVFEIALVDLREGIEFSYSHFCIGIYSHDRCLVFGGACV